MTLAIDQNLGDRELEKSQKDAILLKGKNICVNAGAGSGKTFTILGKILHILDQKLAKPEEIVVMAYNNNVADELRKRFKSLVKNFKFLSDDINKISFSKESICPQCDKQFLSNKFYCKKNNYAYERRIHTFHTYCYDRLKQNEPNIELVDFEQTNSKNLKKKLKTSFFENLISEIGEEDKSFFKKINRFFLSYLRDHRNIFKDIKTYQDYKKIIVPDHVSLKLIERKGEKFPLEVKSVEELEIANFLYLKGIEFVYEDKYPGILPPEWNDSGKDYRPDFHLIKKDKNGNIIYDFYYEHFALDKNYQPPEYFEDKSKYINDFKIKNKIFNGNLIQTFSYQKIDGTLFKSLTEQLRAKGINVPEENVISDKEALTQFKNAGYFNSFSKLLSDFLDNFKAREITISNLKENFDANFIQKLFENVRVTRARAFVEIFEIIFNVYEKKLNDENLVDFHNMIIKGRNYIEDEGIKFLIVDEFQDISPLRSRVIQKIQSNNPNVQLFTVGDDWQSIYRFSGGDIKILVKDFEKYFGQRKMSDLAKTYRFNQRLCELTSSFILRNQDGQMKKVIKGRDSNEVPVEIFTQDEYKFNYSVRKHILEKIDHLLDVNPNIKKILFITRYNAGTYRNNYEDFERYLKNIFKRKKNIFHFSSIHSAKGDEADYVFILNLHDNNLGFPSTIEDDPLLKMVTDKDENFEHEEERRLFYVALTRTKNKSFLYGESGSYFFNELKEINYPKKELKQNFHYQISSLPEQKSPNCDLVISSLRGKKKDKRIDTPAKNAGLEPEDIIIQIDDIEKPTKEDLLNLLKNSNGKSIIFTIIRKEQKPFKISITPYGKNMNKKGIKIWDIGAKVFNRENDPYINKLLTKYQTIKESNERNI